MKTLTHPITLALALSGAQFVIAQAVAQEAGLQFTSVERTLNPPGISLAWPAQTGALALRFSDELSGSQTCWRPWTDTPELLGGEWRLTVPFMGPRRFFRLQSNPPGPPAISFVTPPAATLRLGETLTLQIQTSDPDCDLDTISVTIENANGSVTLNLAASGLGFGGSGGTRELQVPGRALVLGENHLTFRAQDTLGAAGNGLSLTVTLLPQTVAGAAPVLEDIVPAVRTVQQPLGGIDRVVVPQELVWSDADGDVARVSLVRTSPDGVMQRREIEASDAGFIGNGGTARLISAMFNASDMPGTWTVAWQLIDRGGRTSATRSQSLVLGTFGNVSGPRITTVTRLDTMDGMTRWRLSGTGFDPLPDKNAVTHAGQPVTVVSAAVDALVVERETILPGGPVRVKTPGGTTKSAVSLDPPPLALIENAPEWLNPGASATLSLRHNRPAAATVTWKINGVTGGSAADGMVVNGVVRAPARVDATRTVIVTAEVNHEGVAVTAQTALELVPALPLQGSGPLQPAMGGAVEASNGLARLDVPAGALTAPATLSLDVLFPQELPPDTASNGRVLGGVVCGPAGTVFAQPVTLTVPLAVLQKPGTILRAAYFDPATRTILSEAGNAIVTADGAYAQVMVSHFSGIMMSEPLPADGTNLPPPDIVDFEAGAALEEGLTVPVRLSILNGSRDLRASVENEDGTAQTLVRAIAFAITPLGSGVVLKMELDRTLGTGQTRRYRLSVGRPGQAAAQQFFTVSGLTELLIHAGQRLDLTNAQPGRFSDIRVEAGARVRVRSGVLRWDCTGHVDIRGLIDASGERGADGTMPSGGAATQGGTGTGGRGRDDFGCFELFGITFDDDPDDCSEPENFGLPGHSGARGGRPGHNHTAFGEDRLLLLAAGNAARRIPETSDGVALRGHGCVQRHEDLILCEDPDEDMADVWAEMALDGMQGGTTHRIGGVVLPGAGHEGGGGGGGGRYHAFSLTFNGAGGGAGGAGGAGVEIMAAQSLRLTGHISTRGGDGGHGGRGVLALETREDIQGRLCVHFCGGGGGGGGGGTISLGGKHSLDVPAPLPRHANHGNQGTYTFGGFTGLGGLIAEHINVFTRQFGLGQAPVDGRPGVLRLVSGVTEVQLRPNRTMEVVRSRGSAGLLLRARHTATNHEQSAVLRFDPAIGYSSARLLLDEGFSTVWMENGVAAGESPALLKTTVLVLPNTDVDGDGLSDEQETEAGTNPNDADTDNDGLDDGEEFATGTDPLAGDGDNDGLPDPDELAAGTGPRDADSDDDGFLDGTEAFLGSIPLDPAAVPVNIPPGTLYGSSEDFIALLNSVDGRKYAVLGGPVGSLRPGLAFDEFGTLYVASFNALGSFDALTGISTPIGAFGNDGGVPIRCTTLAYNPADGSLYGIELGASPNFAPTAQLLRIDPLTGAATRIGPPGPFALHALVCTRDGTLFATAAGPAGSDRLIELAPATGALVRSIGMTNAAPMFGLAINRQGTMFGSQLLPDNTSRLHTLSTVTGLATPATDVPRPVYDLTIKPPVAPAFGLPVTSLPGVSGAFDYQFDTADLDGDGDLDAMVLSTSGFPHFVSVRHGNNSGALTEVARFQMPGLSSVTGGSIAFGDFNADGRPDALIDNPESSFPGPLQLALLLSNPAGLGGFDAPVGVGGTAGLKGRITAVNLNPLDDSILDFVCGGANANTLVTLGTGGGAFGTPAEMGGTGDINGIAADMNGDGFADLVIPTTIEPGGRPAMGIRLNDGHGVFAAMTTHDAAPLTHMVSLATGDFDGDGRRDLALRGVVDAGGGNVADGFIILRQGTAGAFGVSAQVHTSGFLGSLFAAGDLTGDGRADAVIVEADEVTFANTLKVFAGRANGTLRAAASLPLQSGAYDVKLADANGDGRLDVIVAEIAGGPDGGGLRAYLIEPSF